ncbi:MAG: hypothetical protein WCN98_17390, partial [Verrucomicrobiaceae bacterium]
MKRIFFLAGLIAFFPMISMGVTNGDMIGLITTNSGKAYQNCRIFKIDPDGVFFAHSHGSAKILYVDMPDATRQQLGHDPVKAAEYSAEILAKQKKAREQQFELRKEVIKAQAFAQEVVRRSNEMQSSYPGNGYSPPLTDWVGTIPSFGWSASNNYPGEYAPGRSQNWSPVFNCNSNPNFQHDQYCRVPFHYDPRSKIDHHQYGLTAFNYDSRSNVRHSQYGYATV